jgi:flagellar motor switch protein FliN
MKNAEEIGHLSKVPVTIEAGLDCGLIPIHEILQLEEGSVIRTMKAAGDNIDLHVGGRLVGYGEVVAIENMVAIRITNMKELD